jgi:hypothetical protein
LTKSTEDWAIDLDLTGLDTIYSSDTVYSSDTTSTTTSNWSVCDSDYFSLDNNITITTGTTPAGTIALGNHTITEEKLAKLDALLDVVESAEGSEIKAMFDTALALNKLKGKNW